MNYKVITIVAIVSIIFSSCRKDFQFKDFDYETYNRVVGPQGGSIVYYANYSDDSRNDMVVRLDVPFGALDSLMVFNMYQYENYELATQMEEGFAKFGSKLLYFVPFFESEGYAEREQFELNYHLSVKFKKPITVTYRPLANYTDFSFDNWQEVVLYQNFYKSTNRAYKVFRIKIPKVDEWGENNNIFVNWNKQGYANGYDATDITYVVNGRWSQASAWGTGETSMINWEPVEEFNLDVANEEVSFKIYDTDYIYVVARGLYVTSIPANISTYLSLNYPLLQVKRAAFDNENFKVYFTDNSVAVFGGGGWFEYILRDNLYSWDLPPIIQNYLKINYSGIDVLKGVQKAYSPTYSEWEVMLKNGVRLFFSDGSSVPYQIYQYGYDPASLNDTITGFIAKNYPQQTITNVVYNSQPPYYEEYIVYLTSNIRVYFDGSSNWTKTVFYKIPKEQLPVEIINYFTQYFPNAAFLDIYKTIWSNGSPTFEVTLMGNKWFRLDGKGAVLEKFFKNIPFSELPSTVQGIINRDYPDKIITDIWYRNSYQETNYYRVFFSDYTDAYIDMNGIN